MKYRLNIFKVFIVLFITGVQLNSYAQSSSFGGTYVHSGGQLTVNSSAHYFKLGSGLILPGIVGTDRKLTRGFFGFANNASHLGAADSAFVDGYAKTFNSNFFIFPIGDNDTFRPCAVSTASNSNPVDAAYYYAHPSIAITSSLKGGNEPVLPEGGPFNILSKETDILAIDRVEYWDINGASPAKISLTWNKRSDVEGFTGSQLNKLTIIGWDGTKWVKIASKVDSLSILGPESGFFEGSITTISPIIPNTYNVYTLANGCVPPIGIPLITCLNPSTNCDTVCSTNLSKKYIVTGMTNVNGYNWTVSNGATIVSGQTKDTIEINFNTASASSVVLKVYPYNQCDTFLVPDTHLIVVYKTPKPNAGADITNCLGNTILLSAPNNLNTIYTWKMPSGSTTNNNPHAIPTSTYADSGFYILSQVVRGCPSVINDTLKVSIIPGLGIALTTTNTDPICETNTKLLTAIPANVGTWSILSGGGSILNGIYTPANVSVITKVRVRYTVPDSGFCPSSFSDTSFEVHPIQTIINTTSPGDICESSSKILTATPSGGTWVLMTIGIGVITGNNLYIAPARLSDTLVTLRYILPSFNICPTVRSDISFTVVKIRRDIPIIVLPSTGGKEKPDVNNRACFNGRPARLDSLSSLNMHGPVWETGITIDPVTKQVVVKSGTKLGTYILQYILCDSVRPVPNCIIDTIIVKVTPVIDPENDSVTMTSKGGIAFTNISINDSVNGAKAIIGQGGNATVTTSGVWPPNIILDPLSGKVTVIGPIAAGTYILPYRLCDKYPVPNCKDGFIIIKINGMQNDTVRVVVQRYDTVITICTTIDDILAYPPPYSFSQGPAPKGYTMIGPDSNGCYEYIPDSAAGHFGPVVTYQIICSGGICDTTFIILIPSYDHWVIPNYISPNGDGSNDAWELPPFLYKRYPGLSVSIYNRWGNMVWRSNGPYKDDWKGTLEGSDQTVPDGVYYYLIELHREFKTTKTGFVEVMTK